MKGLQLSLTAQDGDNKFSGEILLYNYVIGTFEVELNDFDTNDVETANYFFDEVKIDNDEFITTLDRLVYDLDYNEFRLEKVIWYGIKVKTNKGREIWLNEEVPILDDLMERIEDKLNSK